MAGLIIKNLYKAFQLEDKKIEVLKDINLSIEDGSFVTLIGKSGCGKTTLLRIICELEEKTQGLIEYTNCKENKKIGIVFQEPRLMPWLTVEENMALPLIRCKNKDYVKEKIEQSLKLLGLIDFRRAYPHQISGGMAQRAALGRTLCYDPEIILMDEPLSALDAMTRRKLQKELIDLFLKTHKTIVFVTHDIEEAIYLGQRIVILNSGRVLKELSVDLDYYRNKDSAEFLNYKNDILRVYKELEGDVYEES